MDYNNNELLFFDGLKQYFRYREHDIKGKTIKSYQRILNHFGIFLRNKSIIRISVDEVMLYFSFIRLAEYEQNTLIPIAIAIRGFFEYFCKIQRLDCIEPEAIRIPAKIFKQPKIISDEDYRKLLSVIKIYSKDPRHLRNYVLIRLLRDTGGRLSEVLSLNVNDLKHKTATISTEKIRENNPFANIFWTEETDKALQKWLKKRQKLINNGYVKNTEALFISIGNQKHGYRFTKSGAAEMLRRYSHDADIPIVNAHQFRHRLAHDIVVNGGSGPDVMNMLRHSSLASSTPYVRMYGKETESRYRLLIEDKSESIPIPEAYVVPGLQKSRVQMYNIEQVEAH